MSMTFTLCPPTMTSRRLRLAVDCAGDCRGLDAKLSGEFPQQHPAKKIPAVVRDAHFNNSLRVGIVSFRFLLTSISVRLFRMRLLIHPAPFRGNVLLVSGFRFVKLHSPGVAGKLRLARKKK
jgi:hypothetical protein